MGNSKEGGPPFETHRSAMLLRVRSVYKNEMNPTRYRWFIVFLLFAITTVNYIDRCAISYAIPLIQRDLGLPLRGAALLLILRWNLPMHASRRLVMHCLGRAASRTARVGARI